MDITFTIMFFLIFSIFIIFAIRPSLITVFSLKKEEDDLRKIDALYENKISSIVSLQSQIEENRENLFLLEEAISNYPQVNKMIKDIKEAADNNSVFISKMLVADVNLFETKKNNLEKITVSIEGDASFENFLKFTADLFNQRRLKVIKNLIISQNPESTISSQLKVNLSVEGYYL